MDSQNVTLSAEHVLKLKHAQGFNDGFNNAVDNPYSATLLKNISDIQTQLAVYGQWLENLNAAYTELGNLAKYDSTASFDASIDSLNASTTNLLKTFNTPVPPELTLIKPVGDFILLSIQASEIKDASKNIDTHLPDVISALSNPATKKQIIEIQTQVASQIRQAALTIKALPGTIDYQPQADAALANIGLKSSPQINTIVNSNNKLKNGFDNDYNQLNFNGDIAKIEADIRKQLTDSYDASLKALSELHSLHISLEKDEKLNLSQINSLLIQLQNYSNILKPIIKPSKS